MAESLHNAPIVLDNGSGTIRAGFAGDDVPKCTFPSWVGRPKHTRVLAGALEGELFIGEKAASEYRGLLKIRYPLEHGIVTDWDDMEKIWEYVYAEGLKSLSEEVRGEESMRLLWAASGPSILPGKESVCSPCLLASRPSYRASSEPPQQPRHRCPNSLRNF